MVSLNNSSGSLPLRLQLNDIPPLVRVSRGLFLKHIYHQQHSPLLDGFPAPCARGRRLLWNTQDIFDWLNSQRTYKPLAVAATEAPAGAPTKRGRGRPRKRPAALGGGVGS